MLKGRAAERYRGIQGMVRHAVKLIDMHLE